MNTQIIERDTERAALVTKTARITGVSKRHVRRVILGEHENPLVMKVFLFLQNGNEQLNETASRYNRIYGKHFKAARTANN